MEIYKTYKHNPPHLFRSEAKYFITASTYLRKHFLNSDSAKERLLLSIQKGFTENGWLLEDWVILNNHYHLMADSQDNVLSLSSIMRDIHKFTALWMKKNITGLDKEKRIWYNYWDTCITYEKSYFARLNYIWHNPTKHGYVEDEADWKFGSYYTRIKNERDLLIEIGKRYPFDKVSIKDDF